MRHIKKPLNGGFLPLGTRRENGEGIFAAGARGGRSGIRAKCPTPPFA